VSSVPAPAAQEPQRSHCECLEWWGVPRRPPIWFNDSQQYGTKLWGLKGGAERSTVTMAEELKGSGILVNAVCPGFTATFPGAGAMGARPVSEGAAGIVWAATLPDDGVTGGFFRDGQPLSW
jgi:NAD(P)-dependent dehydrogenase (short-subunit alcohol dehydrogenase family)